ncbi:disulfide bond formation protein DsbA [Taibaiella sp. KBW10]|nr:disulfide bond formation protein DsbA [Taibaiella sp. KBW10]
MVVEVWSDVMCPFCYIGKRNYEQALTQFEGKDNIEIVWKSFQLDPTIEEDAGAHENIYQYLATRKGISYEQSAEMHQHVIQLAQQAGLTYDFEKAVMTNSFKAHRLIQLAKTKGLGDAAEEQIFRAYFTEGKNVSDVPTLEGIAQAIGLPEEAVTEALTNEDYARKVSEDIEQAQQIGVNGVPFFVFDRKYAVSGAQAPEAFLQTLEKSFTEWRSNHPVLSIEVTEGPSCTPEGTCD